MIKAVQEKQADSRYAFSIKVYFLCTEKSNKLNSNKLKIIYFCR